MTKDHTCANDTWQPEQTMTPHDKLCAAISIIQARILASDTPLIPEKLFGDYYFATADLEMAQRLLCDIIGDVEMLG